MHLGALQQRPGPRGVGDERAQPPSRAQRGGRPQQDPYRGLGEVAGVHGGGRGEDVEEGQGRVADATADLWLKRRRRRRFWRLRASEQGDRESL